MVLEPITLVKYTALWIAILTISVILVDKSKWEKFGKIIFLLFVIPTMLTTLYMAGHTIYKNQLSETKGPVHWHADYEIFVCGEKLDLVDPTGFANKVGSPLFHEHDDHRIHVEGTVDDVNNVNVGAFFNIVGGEITMTSLKYPNQVDEDRVELIEVQNGDECNGEPAELSVYVNGQKIEDPANYMYYPHPQVPPGDCIIVIFGVNNPESISADEYICPFWKSADWNYDNFKELRNEPNNMPTWRNDNWEYIDGEGMVKTGGDQ